MADQNLEFDALRKRERDLKKKISDLRKQNYDMKIAEIKSMSIDSKIGIAESTKESKDIEKVNKLLEELEKEISASKKNKFESNSIINIKILIEITYDLIKANKIEEAKKTYIKIQGMYDNLTKEDKEKTFEQCKDLGEKLK